MMTVNDSWEEALPFANETVRAAADLVKSLQQDLDGKALRKEDRSPVTVADFASQAVVGERFLRLRPREVLVAEESSQRLQQDADTLQWVLSLVKRIHPGVSQEEMCGWIDRGAGQAADRYWTLDPIDGTKGFLRGDQYVVALALIERGRVSLGAMACPNLNDQLEPAVGGPGCVVYAQRGQGAWVLSRDGQNRRLQVSQIDDASRARLLRSFEDAHTDMAQLASLIDWMGISAAPVRMDSQAKYALMAAGQGDLLFRLVPTSTPGYRECIWDQAVGSLVVEEAGGRVTDLNGNNLDFSLAPRMVNNVGVLASNGFLHQAALEALARWRQA